MAAAKLMFAELIAHDMKVGVHEGKARSTVGYTAARMGFEHAPASELLRAREGSDSVYARE